MFFYTKDILLPGSTATVNTPHVGFHGHGGEGTYSPCIYMYVNKKERGAPQDPSDLRIINGFPKFPMTRGPSWGS